MKAFLSLLALIGMNVLSLKADTVDTSDYIPMAKGMKWEALVEIERTNDRLFKATGVREILGTKTINGKDYFEERIVITGGPNWPANINLQRKDEKGVYSLVKSETQYKEVLEIPLPLKVGNTWQVDKGPDLGVSHYKVLSQLNVKIEDQEYKNCFQIELTNPTKKQTSTFYLAKGIGTIMEVLKLEGLTLTFIHRSFTKE